MFVRFLKCESGATAVEYGLIATVLSLAIIGGVGLLAGGLEDLWGDNNGAIKTALNDFSKISGAGDGAFSLVSHQKRRFIGRRGQWG